MTQRYQNPTNNLTRKLILSFPYDPVRPDADDAYLQTSPYGKAKAAGTPDYPNQPDAIADAAPTMDLEISATTFWPSIENANHWQDTISPDVMARSLGQAAAPGGKGTATTDQRNVLDMTLANEFEIDASMITHTWQTLSGVMPMPGIRKNSKSSLRVTEQLNALSIDLGMMREVISVQGIIIDRRNHPSSTSTHHLRRQHLLDICRAQYGFTHTFQNVKDRAWLNINKFPALTIGPMTARDAADDTTYEGDQPSNDPRGREHIGDNGYAWQQDRHANGQPTRGQGLYGTLRIHKTASPNDAISAANPTVITTSTTHNLVPGQKVEIKNGDSVPRLNGNFFVLTTPSSTTFTIPVNVTTAGIRGDIVNGTKLFSTDVFGSSASSHNDIGTTTPPAGTTVYSSWDPTPAYTGRHRYRGMINRVSVTNQGGRPDIWNFTMEFVVLKNEMQMRQVDTGG